MAMTFDATLKDMGRQSPQAFLSAFDRPPAVPVKLLNVDLSTVTTAADLVLGLGEPLQEIVHMDFQSSAAAWKHADVMVYNALLFANHHVPVHTIVLLLRPEAAHANMNGVIDYAPRPGSGRMHFSYQLVRVWELPAAELLAADPNVAPLALLGRLPEGQSLEEGLASVAQQLVARLEKEVPPDRVKTLLTDALLLTGLRVRRDVAARIFRGIRAMQESDTYLMILDEGQEKALREVVLFLGEDQVGAPDESVKERLNGVTDLDRLKRMIRKAPKAANWQEILDTP
ncbi:MAG: hypothetical protein HYS12_28480 [Planctomycetes bacterium]|nr:hypothetical protein [Planctomycetota bacterium]